MNDQKKGYPMFKMDNIFDGFLVDEDVRYAEISEGEFHQCKLVPNDVLFNRVNSEEFVGRTGIYKIKGLDSVFASYLIRLQVDPEGEVLADYLNIFLNCDFGTRQIRKYARRAVNQANVNAEELKQMKIALLPISEQEKIANLANKAWHEFESAKSLYTKAENLLLEELGLKDFKADEDLYSVVNFSDIQSANRMDADYFQPKYKRLIAKLKAQKARPLADVLENVLAKFNPLTQPDKAFKYVELSNIDGSIGIIDGYTETSGREAPSRAKRILKNGDVIVSTVEGSLGKVALVHKEQEGCLASTGFFQFRSDDLLPEVLLVIAKSFIFHNQLEQRCAGTILTAVPKESIRDILVPILSKPIQDKIAELVRESHAARKEAKGLLEEAKRKVEELIESNTR